MLVMMWLVGCVAEDDGVSAGDVDVVVLEPAALTDQSGADGREAELCALAAALPDDDVCSLVCDPAALADRLAADGNKPGFCYQLTCALADATSVLVGVCLPP
jgi:hypothetical protein